MTFSAKSHLWPLFSTSAAAGVILAILAPYGTHQFTFLSRGAFWVGLCIAGGIGTSAATQIMNKSKTDLSFWARVGLQSLGASTMVWLCFLGLTLATQGPPSASFYYLIPFYILLISLVICGVGELIRTRNQSLPPAPDHRRAAIFERLKPALRSADIYALSAEDHYVRVHTSKGSELILMRLSDAIKETKPVKGLQIHRSWWAAEAGVKDITKSESKLSLTLHNDLKVPVSRRQAKLVRDANWV